MHAISARDGAIEQYPEMFAAAWVGWRVDSDMAGLEPVNFSV
jgi:hypothetical protein